MSIDRVIEIGVQESEEKEEIRDLEHSRIDRLLEIDRQQSSQRSTLSSMAHMYSVFSHGNTRGRKNERNRKVQCKKRRLVPLSLARPSDLLSSVLGSLCFLPLSLLLLLLVLRSHSCPCCFLFWSDECFRSFFLSRVGNRSLLCVGKQSVISTGG